MWQISEKAWSSIIIIQYSLVQVLPEEDGPYHIVEVAEPHCEAYSGVGHEQERVEGEVIEGEVIEGEVEEVEIVEEEVVEDNSVLLLDDYR